MSIPEICERIQTTWLSQAISQSTWGYPVVGALHVLSITVFGVALLASDLSALGFPLRALELRSLKRAGLALIILTGALLFIAGAAQYFNSTSFKIKVALLVLIVVNGRDRVRGQRGRMHAGISLALWAAVLFASRGSRSSRK